MDRKAYKEEIERIIMKGPFQATWDSLGEIKVPEWYQKAKFGIFIHWGVYSVPAFGSEWYSRNMYIKGSQEYEHHLAAYGAPKDFGYKDFIPMFKAENFDPGVWADLFQKAGAKYVVPVAEHHDGFQMYASELSEFNAANMGPKRDIVGELKKACNERGIEVGASSHRVEHWFFMGHGKEFDSDIKEPMQLGDFYWPAMPEADHHDLDSEPCPTEEFLEDWLLRTCEIVDRFHPKLVYFDWWIQHSSVKPYLKKFAAYYYNRAAEWKSDAVINYKHDAFVFGTAVPDVERGQFAEIKPFFWQTDTAVARNSWCYTENNSYKSATEIICMFVDIISKNGCLLLNIGPRADGTIPKEDERILLEIGEWMKKNEEAIYGTYPYRESGEGPTVVEEGQFTDKTATKYTEQDIRFTRKGGSLYAFALVPPKNGMLSITTLAKKDASHKANFSGKIRRISLLETQEETSFERTGEAVHIKFTPVETNHPIVFKIEME